MTDLFLQVVNLSYSALWIVAAVVLLRVVLWKAPRWLHDGFSACCGHWWGCGWYFRFPSKAP